MTGGYLAYYDTALLRFFCVRSNDLRRAFASEGIKSVLR